MSVSGDKVIGVRHTLGKLSPWRRAAVELRGAVEVVWTGMLKGFVSRGGDKVDENANAANDSVPARRHLLPCVLRSACWHGNRDKGEHKWENQGREVIVRVLRMRIMVVI